MLSWRLCVSQVSHAAIHQPLLRLRRTSHAVPGAKLYCTRLLVTVLQCMNMKSQMRPMLVLVEVQKYLEEVEFIFLGLENCSTNIWEDLAQNCSYS